MTIAPSKYRDHTSESMRSAVREHYRKMRTNQTVEYVERMHKKYLTFDKPMTVWDAMEQLNGLIDVSDPDLELPNVQHLIQTAEGIRADDRPDWMQLVGLIHDLGKVMYLWGCDEDGTSQNEQWGLVGDIFLVGCALPHTCVYPDLNPHNPDMADERYNSESGMYEQGCGIDNCLKAWGHDEYLYEVLQAHPANRLPDEAMIMIRYHSFYPWHTGGSYTNLMRRSDQQYMELVRDFNRYDLYTKSDKIYSLAGIESYYQPIIDTHLGTSPIYW